MLRYFRKIRQNLAAQNKFTRYLTYALGEIILVVIGILFAVQINGWNQDRKNENLEVALLEKIQQDLKIQLEIIGNQLVFEKQIIDYCNTANTFFQDSISVSTLNSLLDSLKTRQTFIANKATFNSMNTTGNLVLIQSGQIQEEMVRYYQRLDYTTQVINNNNLHLVDDQFGQSLISNGLGLRLLANKEVDTSYQLNGEQLYILKAMLNSRGGASLSIQRNTNKLRMYTTDLIEHIEKELADRK